MLSVHVRTDPRDPANTNHVPAWLTELRNGLRSVGHALEASGKRDERLAFRPLADRVETDVLALDGPERARGLAWFLAADGSLDERLALQLPPRRTTVRWDARPFVSPLVDVAERGRSTGIILVGLDAVRLMSWELGLVEEPDRSVLELELGDWRRYGAYAAANPARGQQTATHVESFERRVEAWRERFLRAAASHLAGRLRELGWERWLLVAEPRLHTGVREALPDALRERLVGVAEANLLGASPAEVAEQCERVLERLGRARIEALAGAAVGAAAAGGRGATGLAETLDALVQHRVEHVVLDPHHPFDPAAIGPQAAAVLGMLPADLVAERAVELAIGSGAEVSALDATPGTLLARAGGIAAMLRH